MSRFELRFRQIHLDFHTSEQIPGVGAAFDPEEFAATLERAHVDSITCFARCHHGMIYFESTEFPERRHPHLATDLLRRQIEACHAHGIRIPIYTTVQWDDYTAKHNPEWLVVDEHGTIVGTPPYEPGFYRKLCVNSPYRDFLKSHTQEILDTLPVDGLFFDIVQPTDCSCRYCREQMLAEGLEPAHKGDRWKFALETINAFKRDMSAFVRESNTECSIFYNAGHIGARHRTVAAAYSHFELESLPSGGWGYLHFPIAMRYARTLGLDCLSHTGKFHTSWGDFHSFKNSAALQFECFRMLALGAKCLIGDQLDPSGAIDRHVYDLVGAVYAEVERKEPWCVGARPLAEIGVFTPEEFGFSTHATMPPAIMGITRMLEESGHQFDIIDTSSDLARYKVVVLPDQIPVAPAFAAKLEAYLAQGGALIASFESGLDPQQSGFALAALGVSLSGEGPRDLEGQLVRGRHYECNDYAEYLLPLGPIGKGLPETEHAMYIRGLDVAAADGSAVLAPKVPSYFDRTYRHFCSHRQTPSAGRPGDPAIVQSGRTIYFAHPIFTQYNQNAPRWCKTLFLNALALLLPEPLLRHDGPSTLLAAVTEQPEQRRWVLHLLHYIPERRGLDFDVIEDVIPLHDLRISLRADQPVSRAVCVPDGQHLACNQADGRVELRLPRLDGHQLIALHFD